MIEYEDYGRFLQQVSHERLDGVEVTHKGHPLSMREAKFLTYI